MTARDSNAFACPNAGALGTCIATKIAGYLEAEPVGQATPSMIMASFAKCHKECGCGGLPEGALTYPSLPEEVETQFAEHVGTYRRYFDPNNEAREPFSFNPLQPSPPAQSGADTSSSFGGPTNPREEATLHIRSTFPSTPIDKYVFLA